jgi:hypothetical protein
MKPHRNPFEQFNWVNHGWDVAKLWGQIDSGELSQAKGDFEMTDFNRSFIEAYARNILGLKLPSDKEPRGFAFHMGIDEDAARALPAEALKEPLMLIHVDNEGGGLLQVGDHEKPGHVLGDGNHRLARAFFDGVDSLPVVLLSLDPKP